MIRPMIELSFKSAKGNFFDRDKVKRAVDRSTRKVLSRFGAFVRQRAKTSIKQRKGTSPPGRPPFSHVGLLRRFILFGFDPAKKSVVIGPTLIRDESQAPRLLEHGGDTAANVKGKVKQQHFRARPFMKPAFEQEIPALPALWRDSVR